MMRNLLKEDIENMKYLFGYKAGRVVSEQATENTADLIKQIQTVLKTKYNANLGTSGPNKDGVDGVWGPKTLAALEEVKKKKTLTTSGNSASDWSWLKGVKTPLKPTTDSQQSAPKGNNWDFLKTLPAKKDGTQQQAQAQAQPQTPSLEDQFGTAQIEKQKAIQDLNKLQNDRQNVTRNQIRAARKVQKNARKKVQGLRDQMYPDQQ
jgi:hypothetical protein